MRTLKPLSSILLVFLLLITPAAVYGQKRTVRTRPAPRTEPAQSLSFDDLLSADTYKIYVEIRNLGQLITSSSINELLEPVLKLAGPPKEFKTSVKWLTAHAELLTTSRVMVATWPTAKDVPTVLMVVEFDNAEEASKFEPQLNEFLPKILPTPQPSPTETPVAQGVQKKSTVAASRQNEPTPTYFIKRSGPLVFVTSSALVIKNLKPSNAKSLAEDQNFRMVRDRFSSEPVFAFFNIKAMEKEEEEKRQQIINQVSENAAAVKREEPPSSEGPEQKPEEEPDEEPPPPETVTVVGPRAEPTATPEPPDPLAIALTQLAGSIFTGGAVATKWPEAIGLAASLDSSSFDLRALLVSAPNERMAPIPFIPVLATGPAITPESPSVLPADTELFVVMSLDVPQIYAALNKASQSVESVSPMRALAGGAEVEPPFAMLEKKLGINFQKDLLPLIGNEIVFSMPVQQMGVGAPPATKADSPPATVENAASSGSLNPIIAISVRDKEGVRNILPNIIESLAFKGASTLAQTERRDDTELVTYANVLSYAFVGNFLVISPDAKATRHVVDSYLKRETLSGDINFRNFTRWQPRQLQGQVYVSPALMESYKTWATAPNTLISDQMREMLMRLTIVAEPITYSLSNEGLGPLHQLRIPKNLLVMAVAGISGETNPPPTVTNERSAMGALYAIAYAEATVHSEKGAYVTLEELVTEKKVPKELLEGHGYKVTLTLVGNTFEAVAVPIEYGKTGKLSYFINETHVIRAGDHAGAPATVDDKPVQ